MMDSATIEAIAEQAAARARAEGQFPVVWSPEEWPDGPDEWARRLPFIGTWRPRGYTLEQQLFVDRYGDGLPGEPALTIPQFLAKLQPGKAYAIIEAGPFQVYIGEFEPPVGPGQFR